MKYARSLFDPLPSRDGLPLSGVVFSSPERIAGGNRHGLRGEKTLRNVEVLELMELYGTPTVRIVYKAGRSVSRPVALIPFSRCSQVFPARRGEAPQHAEEDAAEPQAPADAPEADEPPADAAPKGNGKAKRKAKKTTAAKPGKKKKRPGRPRKPQA